MRRYAAVGEGLRVPAAMSHVRISTLAALAVSGMFAGVAVAVAPAALPAATAAEPATTAFGESAAKLLAVSKGAPVEITSMRSETDQVFANPDGTLTREQFLEPVRIRRADQWLDVDSTLVRRGDGSWGPRAAAVDISFSNGGTGPAVKFGHGNAHLT